MKAILALVLTVGVLLVVSVANAQQKDDPELPALRKIMRITLSPSYSCRTREDRRKGYGNTALFLSGASKDINGPELLFNGACKSPDYFVGRMAGDDFDVIADYGDVPLDNLTASHAFSPLRRTDSIATFADQAPVKLGHTYGLLINKGSVRGLVFFKVVDYVPNQKVDLDYVVMDYQILRIEAQAPDFGWDKKGAR